MQPGVAPWERQGTLGPVDIDAMPEVVLGAALARTSESLLRQVVEGMAACPDVVLARIWLLRRAAGEGGVTSWLELMASAGNLRRPGADARACGGRFARILPGQGEVGQVAESGQGLYLERQGTAGTWAFDPAWAGHEGAASFAAEPLSAHGERLGVLALFDRRPLSSAAVAGLRVHVGRTGEALHNVLERERLQAVQARLARENHWLREELYAPYREILGCSHELNDVLHRLTSVAPTERCVLVTGEPGVGKELMAHALHARSARRDGPFVRVACAGATGEQLEVELFGRAHPGKLELAEGGTLYLDEVSELPPGVQAKLLRVIETGAFERVGDAQTRRVSVRFVAATSHDLSAKELAFREGLLYQLGAFTIRVPPLRDRRADVPALAALFVERAARRLRLPVPVLTEADERALASYDWPGNVHELASFVERAVMLGRGKGFRLPALVPGLVEKPLAEEGTLMDYAQLKRREREHIEAALRKAGGKVSGKGGAAGLLGLKPSTLESKLRALGLRPRGKGRSR